MTRLFRPSKHLFGLSLAQVAAERATCLKRQVGCVLADERCHVLSVAYNGVASGRPHCNLLVLAEDEPIHPNACEGWRLPSGQDSCQAVHAEQNALIQCRDPFAIHTAYLTLSPCKACVKLLLNTSCKAVVFIEEHEDDGLGKKMWEQSGRSWIKWDITRDNLDLKEALT